jgi:hypothetical protein
MSMNKHFFLLAFTLLATVFGKGQAIQRQQVAIFMPLYLDSVMDASGNARFDSKNFPKYVLPGLDYYQGVQAAIDSLQRRGAPLEFFLYDSRGRQSLTQVMNSPALREVDLVLGHTNAQETRLLADAAQRKKIPFISTTFPNDAGVSNNPYFVVLNSTLQTHVEGIYQFLQKHHSNDRIVLLRRSGSQEDQLLSYLTEFGKQTTGPRLSIAVAEISGPVTAPALTRHLDSTRRNVCLAGTLDEGFAQQMLQELNRLGGSYSIRAIGMPTWDRLNFPKNNLDIIYTTPFFYNRNTSLEQSLGDAFQASVNTKPSDLFFRGYETTLRFSLLLLDAKKDISSNLTRKGNTVFTPFLIEPVFKDRSNMTLDFFENKHLYFIRVMGGSRNIIN